MNAHEQIMFQCGIEKQIRKEHGGPLSKACRAEIYLKSYTHTPSYKLPRLGKCLQQLFLPEMFKLDSLFLSAQKKTVTPKGG